MTHNIHYNALDKFCHKIKITIGSCTVIRYLKSPLSWLKVCCCLVILWPLLFHPFTSRAQLVGSYDVDSLSEVWNDKYRSDSLRLDAIEKLFHQKWYNTSTDSMILLVNEMYQFAKSTDQKYFQGQALLHRGHLHIRHLEFNDAMKYYDQCLDIFESIDDKKSLALTYIYIAAVYKGRSNYPISAEYLMKSIEITEDLNDIETEASAYISLGSNYLQQGKYAKGREYFEKSLELFRKLRSPMYINALKGNIGLTYGYQGDYEKALAINIEASDYALKTNDKMNLSAFYHEIGKLYSKTGNFNKALEYLFKSLELTEELDSKISATSKTVSIGDVYLEKGDYIQALDYYKSSLHKNELNNYKKGIAECYGRIGFLYFRMKNYSKSLDYFKQGINFYQELDILSETADLYGQIGQVFNSQKEYIKALDYYTRSLTINEEIGRVNAISDNYRNFGIASKEQGNFDLAIDYFKKSKIIREEIGDKKGMAEIYLDIGEVNLDQDNIDIGLEWCLKGHDLAVEIGILRLEQEAAYCLYKAHKALGNGIRALDYHERYLALQDSLRTDEASRQLQQMEFDRQRMADSLIVVEDKLKTELAYQETLSQEKNTRNTIMFAGFAILLVAAGLFGRMRFIRKTNKELEQKNRIIAREKDRAEESERAKEQFFSNVSHEFRTPLTLILGPLEEALETTSENRTRSSLQTMKRNALRLQEMITELLDLSKLEFGKIKLEATEENIVKLTEEYLQSFESLADQRRIKLRFKSDAKEYKAWVDVEKFRKILANLLSNAFKFTDEGGEIIVAVGSPQSVISSPQSAVDSLHSDFNTESTEDWRPPTVDSKRNGVEITISDTGIGIPKDKLPSIFDRFYQVGEPSHLHHAGTGIGLALTKELVELHHGSVTVESEKGKGTTFFVFIPFGKIHLSGSEIRKEDIDEKAAEKTEWVVEKEISGHVIEEDVKKKNELPILLIVEDNNEMRSYIKNQLDQNYTVIEAADGEEGLQKAIDQVPDLIISDVMMPRMDGYEMTDKIKADERTSHIPVLILTARSSVESRIEGLETGADAYLIKPFNARELKVRVRKLIEQRQKLREHYRRTLESLDVYLVKDPQLPSMDQQFIQKAQEVVNNYLSDSKFSAKEFASEMALSRVQLHRKIKALTNKTTTEFIRTIRLNEAALRLKSRTGNVTDIAYEVGFSSLSYFSKVFKEQFGETPSEFLNQA